MSLPVIVKSTKRGILLVLDDTIPFKELLDNIQSKFEAAKEFYKNAQFSLCFSGRVLSFEEEKAIIQMITDTCQAEILCVIEENELVDTYITQKLEQIQNNKLLKYGNFHKGDIHSGQTLECEHSVIIIGSIFPGGKVISKGNIIVIGTLYGYAYAGVSGKRDAKICALHIDSTQLRIADCTFRNTGVTAGSARNHTTKLPQMARAKEKTIVIEPIKGYFDVI